jgi:phosphoesterase RecJ-like protein
MRTAKRHLLAAQSVYVACHIMPDGDAVGSLLGLGLSLRQLGKRCTMACADPAPAKFDFLPGFSDIVSRPPDQEQVIVTVDCSDTERLGALFDPATFAARTVINIDHHVTNTRFGDVNVRRDLPSAAEIVYALIRRMDVQVDRDIASALLTGLVTDTRCFRTGNVTPKQLRTAMSLMSAGASLTEITELVFNREPIARICLWGQALANVQTRGRIIWTEVDRRMIRKCGATPDEGGGLVSFLASAMGVAVAVVFREQDDGRIEASMRAGPGWDVTSVALQFGGGGHPRAAGCTVTGELESVRERVLTSIETVLEEQESGTG